MLKQLLQKSPPVPNLVIAQKVIDKMQIASGESAEDETGEAMVGLIISAERTGVPTIYVLDTISPDDSAVRQLHMFQQGDELQDEMLWWLQENWHKQRGGTRNRGLFVRRQEWDAPLRYVGDWHKHPGYMISPSGGDLQTALAWLDDPESNIDFLLVPIVTVDHPSTVDPGVAGVNYIVVPQGDGTALRVDWWYVHRDWGMFQPITPAIYPDDRLPALAPIPWHLKDQDRAQSEWDALEEAGFAITVLLADVNEQPPLEVCISAARLQGAEKIYLIATNYDYPFTPPQMRLAPFVSLKPGQAIADVFAAWWKEATPADAPPDFIWNADKTLTEYIVAIEKHMGIYTPPTATAQPQEQTEKDEL